MGPDHEILPGAAETQVVERLHAAPQRLVLEFAGAGSLGLFWLHSAAGSSRTVLEATDRYAAASLEGLLGERPASFVSPETARAMAEQAYHRASRLTEGVGPVLGVGCTATIATDRVKRGRHRCCIAVRAAARTASHELVLGKGARDRLGEERVVALLLLDALADACGLPQGSSLALLAGEERTFCQDSPDGPIERLLRGAAGRVVVTPEGWVREELPVRGALLSGSFNPLHEGHLGLAGAAEEALGMPVTFELPVWNADKPPLDVTEVMRRAARFRRPLALSRAPLFVDKAALFPGCVFVIGFDTAARLVEPRYYGGEAGRDAALEGVRRRGCRFLVAGRLHEGRFRGADELAAPPAYRELFQGLPEGAFRSDLSSTAIRAGRSEAGGENAGPAGDPA